MQASSHELDLGAHYSVRGFGRIAFYLRGYATTWTDEEWVFVGAGDDDTDDEANYAYNEPEELEDRTRVRAVMVGDDREHIIDVDELELLDELAYCAECGQIGCTHDGRERDEDDA